jgi:hypothetical protein
VHRDVRDTLLQLRIRSIVAVQFDRFPDVDDDFLQEIATSIDKPKRRIRSRSQRANRARCGPPRRAAGSVRSFSAIFPIRFTVEPRLATGLQSGEIDDFDAIA